MDSFFSLFDPSEGSQNKPKNKKRHKPEQDTVKKKPDAPKGRRRGRKSAVKNETLPEESSFLCEPDLSTDLLVKDVSYIENFIEINKKEDDKTDPDKKPRRRNSGRKCRRKKNKISPLKDLPNQAWVETNPDSNLETKNWNNQLLVQKICDENIGKNVNDLKNEMKIKNKRNEVSSIDKFRDRDVYNVIDKLEKVILKDDMYLAGDFDANDLENDFFYSSDDLEDFIDDSTSEPDDSGDEVYGSLPPEPRFGNVEYKLQLVSLCERRFQHLVTQLKWRLRSGGGSAVYVLGVRDCGALVGLRARALRGSLVTLRRMAGALGATLTHVTARRVAPHRAVAEVYVRKLPDPKQSVELRVAVMGANEAGKSTLIGVLTQGELDNGRGSARLNMFRHLHEVKSGRTSSLSHEILGFDAQGNVVNYGCSELMTAERIGERSAKLVSFLDLAGHSKYQRTTLHGLTGYSPHYVMLVISATAGITPITEEHISLLSALDLPFFAVISKCELAATAVRPLTARLAELLAASNKKPLLITDENLARNCVAPQKLIIDALDHSKEETIGESSVIPVFPVSSVRGVGLSALHAYLLALRHPQSNATHRAEDETCEFQIDEIFHVGDNSGPVVGGLLARGQLREGDNVIIGPLEDGSFAPTSVRSIYRNRAPCGWVRAGQCASVGLCAGAQPRPGMVLLAPPRRAPRRPAFGACAPGECKQGNQLKQLIEQNLTEKTKNRKNVRRKNKNLLGDVESDERAKDIVIDSTMLYDDNVNDAKYDDCVCADKVLLEDPNDPRGCIYFQASVHVLRHSTVIYPGFQCTVHVGNVRQTAIIEGIMSLHSVLRADERASVLFRFVRCPEYLVRGRRLLFTAGLGTRGIGRITQVFPYVP
ncbi:GTP-binding protein 2 [Spodoptera frugiperda]|uniref:GTP-binding protein 2 n=1 Tax=Spodoptera frugiperda TaxID=7108 RepID=A0A9R0F0S0_SPOFR|nr:GTP-binding protein 2 [Spodoptera frugiperda]